MLSLKFFRKVRRILPSITEVPSVSSVSSAKTVVSSLLFSGLSAGRTPLRFVLEPFFLVKSLFTFRKHKFSVAIFAN